MPNITLSIPKEVYEKMKKYKEVKWSEVARRAIVEYLEKLEKSNVYDVEDVAIRLGEDVLSDVEKLNIDDVIKSFEKMRELEWKRFFTTLAT
ncbi:MAG: hypothetical protein DRJ33_04105 [Candidatus Methanomethylicota archaeon]|uniref:Uncharacterized protein n=1 Tax=Thermoproteota archaeon TaxID=2056631 RepID=A0A497EY42_9CREN|nr:MAG: hypothetical protein DRJ33_04105 [Candidatus Verstraetearchaeota archaeon]